MESKVKRSLTVAVNGLTHPKINYFTMADTGRFNSIIAKGEPLGRERVPTINFFTFYSGERGLTIYNFTTGALSGVKRPELTSISL